MNNTSKELMVVDINTDFKFGKYQRPEDTSRVNKIAKEWDKTLAKDLIVSLRDDGCFYVIDGRHTLAAARLVGEKDISCIIHLGLTLEDECNIFANQNSNSRTVRVEYKLGALYISGNQHIREVVEIFDRFRIDILCKKCNGEFRPKSIQELRNLFDGNDGIGALVHLLRLFSSINWIHTKKAYEQPIIQAFNSVYHKLGEEKHVEFSRLQSELSKISPDEFLETAVRKYSKKDARKDKRHCAEKYMDAIMRGKVTIK